LQNSFIVIPAKAGIQVLQAFLDPGLRRGDGLVEFCKRLRINRIRTRKDEIRQTAAAKIPR